MIWTCPICGHEHAADAPCPTVVNRPASGTRVVTSTMHFALNETPLPEQPAPEKPGPPVADGSQSSQPLPPPVSGFPFSPAAGPTPPPPDPAQALVGPDPLVGTTIGSFKIVRSIGRGGMGTVYLGEQTVIGSKVAIKILHDHLASNASLVQRFYAEARAVNLIGHENIVNIFDMNVVPPNRYYLIMEYLEGRPLSQLLRGPVPPEIAIPILLQVCDALQAAHAHGVAHRDLKPENIYLVKRGRTENFVKILDFGIAKLFATEIKSETTSVGTIVGTPEYMAPEQSTGDKVDGRSDIYALGVIAYLMATGRLPFQGGGLAGLLIAHQQKTPQEPSTVNPKVPQAWGDAIMKALAKKPDDRYRDADGFGLALADVMAQLPQPQSSAPRWYGAATATPEGRRLTPPAMPAMPRVAVVAAGTENTPPQAVSVDAPPAAPLPVEPPPQPAHSRHQARFDAVVTLANGTSLGSLPCQDISKGGMFLCTEQPAPPVFSRVKVQLPTAGDLECHAEVVRHVTAEQAKAWNMSCGFGVQFLELTAAQKDVLGRVVQGLPVAKVSSPPLAEDDDDVVAKSLDEFSKRINGDHYVVMALPPTAELSDIRQRGRELMRELDALKQRPVSKRQHQMIATVLQKVQDAMAVIGTAAKRLEFDANRSNFVGVWYCIAAGLTVTEIDAARRRFLESHVGADATAQLKFMAGNAHENAGELGPAKTSYEEALTLDPLNLRFHQRYRELMRRTAS